MTIKNIGLAALVLCGFLGLLAFCGIGIHVGAKGISFGSSGNASETYYNSQWLVGGNQIGPTGTLNANSQFGTCNLIGASAGISATSTSNFDCAVAGIQKGDTIFGESSVNATTGILGDITVIRAVASSTNGFVTFTLANLSGAASTTLGANVASGTEYVTWR